MLRLKWKSLIIMHWSLLHSLFVSAMLHTCTCTCTMLSQSWRNGRKYFNTSVVWHNQFFKFKEVHVYQGCIYDEACYIFGLFRAYSYKAKSGLLKGMLAFLWTNFVVNKQNSVNSHIIMLPWGCQPRLTELVQYGTTFNNSVSSRPSSSQQEHNFREVIMRAHNGH